MFENKTRVVRNSLAIFLAGTLSFVGIYLSSQFLEWELKGKIDRGETLFIPSIVAFSLVGAVIGWLAYFEDVKKIMWNFIIIVLIFGVVFPIIVCIFVFRGQLDNTALANLIEFPGSWFAAYVIYKSANSIAEEHGHRADEFREERAKHDAAIDKLHDQLYHENKDSNVDY